MANSNWAQQVLGTAAAEAAQPESHVVTSRENQIDTFSVGHDFEAEIREAAERNPGAAKRASIQRQAEYEADAEIRSALTSVGRGLAAAIDAAAADALEDIDARAEEEDVRFWAEIDAEAEAEAEAEAAGEFYAAEIEIPAEDSAAYPTTWIADPHIIRNYVRIDISAADLDPRSASDLAVGILANRGAVANIDNGETCYDGIRENRITLTLFEVSLESAFYAFAEIRAAYRAADFDNDCARFYVAEDNGETSHCAKVVAPYWYTIAAGLNPRSREANAYETSDPQISA